MRTRFDRMFAELSTGCERAWTPAIDVVRDDGNLVVHAELPGDQPEEVKIDVEDDILTVSGERQEHKEEKDKLAPAPATVSGLTRRRPRNSPTPSYASSDDVFAASDSTPKKRPRKGTRPPLSPEAPRTTTTSAERDRLQQMITRRAGRGLPAPLDRACCPSRVRFPGVASSQTDSRSREEDDDDDAARP
ncbi:MAG: Hsp20/alpha crystallin family protein [Solirubrobacteraceae bacterium]